MRSHDTLILGKPTSDVCGQSVSLGTSSGQVQQSWERHHNEKARTSGGQCVAPSAWCAGSARGKPDEAYSRLDMTSCWLPICYRRFGSACCRLICYSKISNYRSPPRPRRPQLNLHSCSSSAVPAPVVTNLRMPYSVVCGYLQRIAMTAGKQRERYEYKCIYVRQ